MAPGTSIMSSIPGGGLGSKQGTSIELDSPASWIGWTPSVFDIAPGELQIVEVDINYSLAPVGDSQRRLLITSDDPNESPFPDGVYINVSVSPTTGDDVFKDGFE